MALKRIAGKGTKAARQCINCNEQLVKKSSDYVDKAVYRCPKCGKKQLILIKPHNIVNTDFDWLKKIEQERNQNGYNKGKH
jgi:DNA-directed RNA polymerase subunit RPC12/RpoP